MPASAADVWTRSWWAGLKPDPRTQVSEWADGNRFLESRSSAEPGAWRTARTPYLRELMDALSPTSPVEHVVFMKAARIGGTEVGNNWIGYVIDAAPGPMLVVLPTLVLAQRYSRQTINSMLSCCPSLREKVREPRSRDSGNTALVKEFPGGVLIMAGSNSAAGLRGMSAKYLMLDDVDGFVGDAEGEGDPAQLAINRTRTFEGTRKIYENSTPTFTGRSRIARSFEETDQRYYHVPCPDCGRFQALRWSNVRWEEGKPDTAAYACEGCGVLIQEHRKTEMLEAGKWVASREDKDPRVRGYHLNSLYAPLGFYSWKTAAREWIAAKKNPGKLRSFINTVLGETWRDTGEAPAWQPLYDRREEYPIGKVPERGLVLTAGADVQPDRIECEIVAWGRGLESWSIEYLVFPGDTSGEAVWQRMDELLARTWPHANGNSLPLRMLAVDAGYTQSVVTAWARRKPWDRVMAIKGMSGAQVATIVGQPSIVDVTIRGRRTKRGARLWPVGVGLVKGELYGWLRQQRPEEPGVPLPPGWCHFPQYPEEYFKQLTAEELKTHEVRGYPKTEWEKLPNRRNEVLDCRAYARAAANVVGLDRYREDNWLALEGALGVAPPPARPETPTPAPRQSPAPPRARRRPRGDGGFLARWRKD